MYCKNNFRKRLTLYFLLIFAASELAAATHNAAQEKKPNPRAEPNADTVFTFEILQAGWHTGIVLKTADIKVSDWPEVKNYRGSKRLDIGWGDEQFYQADGNPPLLAVRAIMIPTSAVIHVVPFSIPPESLYAGDIYLATIQATPGQYAALCRVISDSFERDRNGQLIQSRFYNNSSDFFKAKGKYHLFNTCNTWVARCLHKAGFGVNPSGISTGRQLVSEIEKVKVK